MNKAFIIGQTKKWIQDFVLKHNLCPFALLPFTKEKVRYRVVDTKDPNHLIQAFLVELDFLSKTDTNNIETSFIIHPFLFEDFLDYNDLLFELDQLLDATKLRGVLQLASFHPDYQFADTAYSEPGNWTNRSPFPMIHLLREKSIENALKQFNDTDQIWQRNIELMEELAGKNKTLD